MKLEQHPTVRAWRQRQEQDTGVSEKGPLGRERLRSMVLAAGADDVGFVSLDRPELDDQRAAIVEAFPRTRTLISFVKRMNREAIRSTTRSLANLEFHHCGDSINAIGREVAQQLEREGVGAVNVTMGFPMEMDRWPGRIWTVSHKPVAVAAGLGQMGIHRNVIHPKFGNFILLGTVLVEVDVADDDQPIDYNPCLECKLCVAACPTGAIGSDGHFNFSACYTHNYREFMGGFSDWVEQVADSRSSRDYRRRVSDSETVSMWQSLSFGANYKAAYCLSVCPAGEDVIGPFLENRKGFVKEVVRPLQQKEETIYVVPGSDAEAIVAKRFKAKRTQRVSNGIRPRSIASFMAGMNLAFQPGQAKELQAVYHFTFVGAETAEITAVIDRGSLTVSSGLHGEADLHVTADSTSWLEFLAGDANIVVALMMRRIRLDGPLALLKAFGRCFP